MRRQVGSTVTNKVFSSVVSSSSSLSEPLQQQQQQQHETAPLKRTRGISIHVIGIMVGLVACVVIVVVVVLHSTTTPTTTTTMLTTQQQQQQQQPLFLHGEPQRQRQIKVDDGSTSVTKKDVVTVTTSLSLSSSLPPSNATIVTAYFSLASKFPKENYDKWMSNMLSLQDSMVIYTSPNLVEHMQAHRRHAPTVVIGMDLKDLPLAREYSADFWQQQLDHDPEKRIHKSYQLFWIWLSKSWFVTDAIHRNYYHSHVYIWSDIGCFRNTQYNSKTMMQHYDMVPPSSILQMAHHDTQVPPFIWWNNKYAQKPNFYHSGSQMVANAHVWNVWHQEYTTTMKGFIERHMFIGEDQTVAQSTCLRVPDLCRYVPTSQVRGDNHYFGLRYVLHHGGNYTYWRPPDGVPAEPKEMEQRKLYQV